MTPKQISEGCYAVASIEVTLGQYGLWETLKIFEEALVASPKVGPDPPIGYDLRWLRNKHDFRSKR